MQGQDFVKASDLWTFSNWIALKRCNCMSWKKSSVSFPSHKEKLLSLEMWSSMFCHLEEGWHVEAVWGKGVLLFCSILPILMETPLWGLPASRVRKRDKANANSDPKNVSHGLAENVCPQTPALLPLTYFLFSHEEHETTYYTRYFIAFASDIFSVW